MEEKQDEEKPINKEDENTPLTKDEKKEKKSLIDIINDLSEDLNKDENESINDVYSEYLNNEDVTKRDIADNTGRLCLSFMFYILSPLFSLINLIAIFQGIHILNTLGEIIWNSISYYYDSLRGKEHDTFSIEEFNDTYNFYDRLMTRTLNETFDFNLMMLMSFLGEALLKAKGLTFTILIFGIAVNGISFFLLYNFNFKEYDNENNTYTILQILHLIGCYILLFIGVGASALLSQKIIIDSNKKYNKYLFKLKQIEEEENKKREEERAKKEEEKKKLKDENKRKKKLEEKGEENQKEMVFKEDFNAEEEEKEKNDSQEEKDKEKEEEKKENLIDNYELIQVKEDSNVEDKKEEGNLNDDNMVVINNNLEFENIETNDIKNKNNEKETSLKHTKTKLAKKKTISEKRKQEKFKRRRSRKLIVEEKNIFDSFFEICLTTILANFSKYFFNINLTNEMLNYKHEIKENKHYNNLMNLDEFMKSHNSSKVNQTLYYQILDDIYDKNENLYLIMIAFYVGALFISWIFYKAFVKNLQKKEITQNKEGDTHRICEIFGYIIYSENKNLTNKNGEKKDDKNMNPESVKLITEDEKPNKELNDLIEEEKEPTAEEKEPKEEEKKLTTEENNKEEEKEEKYKAKCCLKCKCIRLLSETCINCYNVAVCNSFMSCVFCHEENPDPTDIINCCCCCSCCLEYDEDDYDKDKQFFCYCYQVKRKQKWLNKFLTNEIQMKIVPYLIEYFILRLSIIGFEKQYEMNKIDFKIEENYIFIAVFVGTFFLFFYFTLSFSKFINILDNQLVLSSSDKKEKTEKKVSSFSLLSNEILSGVNGILFFNSIFSLVFSSIFNSKMENDNKQFIFTKHNYIIFIPLLMGKFYHFTLIYYCISCSEDNKKFELISGSTLISLYLSVWEIIISLIKSLCDVSSINRLYITQLVFSSLVVLYFIIVILIFLCDKFTLIFDCSDFCAELGKICHCICSFFFCCSGFWYSPKAYEDVTCGLDCDCDCDCPISWCYLNFNCCCCQEDNFYYCIPCCDSFDFCDPFDYIRYIMCCCLCCWLCCDGCSCFHCQDYCNCCNCDCDCDCCTCGESCCEDWDCCGCCFAGYCCYCCDCCEINDYCDCCSCIYCCGSSCSCNC